MSDKNLDELKGVIASANALIQHLLGSLRESSLMKLPAGENPPNALALASSVASLVHAQTTKLSLLAVNKPFTPTAISKIIKSLSAECIPALATASELASLPQYPKCVRDEISKGATSILQELQALLREIPVDEPGVEQTQSRGTFSYTGVIWAACDELQSAGRNGIHEIAASKADSLLCLVKDALEELREWRDSGMGGDDDDDDDDEGGDGDEDDEEADMMMNSKCPREMLEITGQMISVIDHIRLLYPPVVKRRIKRFPALKATTNADDMPESNQAKKLDLLLLGLEGLQEEVDQAAFVLYENGHDEAVTQIKTLARLGQECASSIALNWTGNSDELTSWINDKYVPKMQELVATTDDHVNEEISLQSLKLNR